MQFPEFVEFAQASGQKKEIKGEIVKTDQEPDSVTKSKTPEELIGSAYEELHSTLRNEVLDLVRKMDPFLFEHLVIDLLVAMGYGGSREEAARVTKQSGDEGIDGVIN